LMKEDGLVTHDFSTVEQWLQKCAPSFQKEEQGLSVFLIGVRGTESGGRQVVCLGEIVTLESAER
ncbi:MAG: hypothetical protein KDD55_13890, partial [Bdellovibrionales bacterium]|nr:hypothetical protein [Bdellovibrionales bacterium]